MINKTSGVSLRSFSNSSLRRQFLEKNLDLSFKSIDQFAFSEEQVLGKNIENLIGAIQVPLAAAGPIKLFKDKKDYFVPLATTEGALVASISRGLKAISQTEGAKVTVELVGTTRGPVFKTKGIEHNLKIKTWLKKNFPILQKIAVKTSRHLQLISFHTTSLGKNLFVRFEFDTQDAMGMNMATFATEDMVKLVEQQTHSRCLSLAGNFDIDKKPAWLNFILGRGRKVSAEVTLKKKIVQEILKVAPEQISELVYRKCHLGSVLSGSLGFNAHFANIVASLYLATGQDLAHVVEGSLGITTAEVDQNGDLYFSIYMPSIVVGIIGGGTKLPTQQEALAIMGIKKSGDIIKYCQLLGASTLAGELSLIASLAEGTLATAHKRLARKEK